MNLQEFISLALKEDIGDGDHTSLACIEAHELSTARLLVKEDGILAGIEVALQIFKTVDPTLSVKVFLHDGDAIKVGDVAFEVSGPAQSILTAERLVLNCMQRMSGIASLTHRMSAKLAGTKAKLLDTRKTTPGMRALEKWAVKIGGGENHRFGLFDMIMIKDNHVDYAGGIQASLDRTYAYLASKGKNLQVEIEVRNLSELQQVLDDGRANRVMLDNFSVELTKEAVDIIDGRMEIESSGGITIDDIASYAQCGIDYISSGALTHSVKSLDLSLKAV